MLQHTEKALPGSVDGVLAGSVETSVQGFLDCSKAFHDLSLARANSQEAIFDLSDLSWIDANMCAVIGSSIFWIVKEYGPLNIRWPIKSSVRDIMRRNNFISVLTKQERQGDYANTTISFSRFTADTVGERDFAGHAYQLFENRDTILISKPLKRALMRCVLEIFNNSVIHSNSKHGIFSCGQFYPRLHRLRLTISDVGDGILPKVSSYLKRNIEAHDAIDWAMREGNTTKTDAPGGLGLGLLIKFIEINQGRIQIVSGNGYWEKDANQVRKRKLYPPLIGTSVNITIMTNTNCEYQLTDEGNDDDLEEMF